MTVLMEHRKAMAIALPHHEKPRQNGQSDQKNLNGGVVAIAAHHLLQKRS
jgi:hypothetical protein